MSGRELAIGLLLAALAVPPPAIAEPVWRRAGLSDRQAARHLLDRLTFGPRPGEVDRVLEIGIERWIELQLAAAHDDSALERRLATLPGMTLAAGEVADVFPPPGRFLREAREAGVLGEEVDPRSLREEPRDAEAIATRAALIRFAGERGYRRQRELIGGLVTQKLGRALAAENQLREVLTDFWFNHFNVALTDPQSRPYLLAYERDAIRPHVLGSFRQMLGATARHPAMLLYLDNALSTAAEGTSTTLSGRVRPPLRGRLAARSAGRERPRGLNENYARELLELHTLGVDGGYDQRDVVEVARAFTGWTVLPGGRLRQRAGARLEWALASGTGFVAENGFLFRADAHDAGAKVVLGRRLAPGRGIEDGEEVLDLVALHPATGRHLAAKLAVRFVADDPPPALVDRLALEFRRGSGDLGRVMRALLDSEEFWAPEVVGGKIKSPLELAISALRGTAAELVSARALAGWIDRMGQPLYAYQAPTGYPDRADHWVNTGALLNRMNFALALAAGRVPGVRLDLARLAGGREPESRAAALDVYLGVLLPAGDPLGISRRLELLSVDPGPAARLDAAPPDAAGSAPLDLAGGPFAERRRGSPWRGFAEPPTAVEQVVGVILGSPEFQRR